MHCHAVASGEQHLKVVVLVANRHGLSQWDVEARREPLKCRPFIDAWFRELQLLRVADGDIKIAPERFARLRQHRLWVTGGRMRNNLGDLFGFLS